MGIHIVVLGGKDHADNLVKDGGIVVNDIPPTADAHQDFRNALIQTVEGTLSIESRCKCGVTKQARHSTLPNQCPVCGTDPADNEGDDIPNLLYLRTPIGVDKLITVNFWNQMRNCFVRGKMTGKGISILRWITDPSYVINDKFGNLIIEYLEANGVTRGYNNFIRNIDRYLRILSKEPTTFAARDSVKDLIVEFQRERSKVFTDHIPFMDKITRIMEKSADNKRADGEFTNVIDAIMGVVSIDDIMYSDTRREAIIARFMEKYTMYWDNFLAETIQGKYGFIRGTLYRARGTRNSRLILSSTTEPHNQKNIQLPWVAMIYNLETAITSILLRKGLTLLQVKDFIQYSYSNFNVTMKAVIDKIISDCRNSLPVTLQRYPTLTRGSILFLNGGTYKTDPEDYTVSISPLIIYSLNADFDGDNGYVQVYLDKLMANILKPLEYHYNCLDTVQVRTVKNVGLTVPLEANLLTWLEDADQLNASESQTKEMLRLFG